MSLENLITALPPTIGRNNLTASLGYQFTPVRIINVTQLGRVVDTIRAQTHRVIVWRVSDQANIGQADITPSSPTQNGWAYEPASITLESGVAYRIASQEYTGGDKFADLQTISGSYNASAIATDGHCYSSGTHGYPDPMFSSASAYAWPGIFEGTAEPPAKQFHPLQGGNHPMAGNTHILGRPGIST